MSVLLSIVIPVYNVAEYIPYCLENIVNKNSNEIEIILVDDGSTDSSGTVIDEFANQYQNVISYHKANGGLSDARNFGLLKSSGKYVFFFDSDDFVTIDFISSIINTLKKDEYDAVLWDADIYDEHGKRMNVDSSYYHHTGLKDELVYTGKEVIEYQLQNHNDYVTTVWLGLYSRRMLIDNCIWFEKGLLHEDEMWTQKVFLASSKIKYLESAFYCYRKRSNSIMNPADKDWSRNIEALIYTFSSLPSFYDWAVKDESFKKKLKGNTTKRFLHMIGKYQLSRYPKLISRVNRRMLLLNANTLVDKIRAFILCLSVSLYCWIAKRFKR
ncbi:MAG: glycosyltransferase [Anaerobutyricum hallii]|uniref:glycosyltransferase n=1 Tax=Anaerobutyricum hallii TaxID=39488 RepID=UPI002A82B03C|nr:glycosyltransferase [Anaerobutyricum hallii]MDY4576875.1 glycosyltransferase [Anaerobutyricum hallii]